MAERHDLVAQIAANKRRTIYVMVGFTLFVTAVVAVFDLAFTGGPIFIAVAVVVALVMVWGGYFYSDKLAIAASRGVEADPARARALVQRGIAVADLEDRAIGRRWWRHRQRVRGREIDRRRLLAEQPRFGRCRPKRGGEEGGGNGGRWFHDVDHHRFWFTYLSMSSVAEIIFELTS